MLVTLRRVLLYMLSSYLQLTVVNVSFYQYIHHQKLSIPQNPGFNTQLSLHLKSPSTAGPKIPEHPPQSVVTFLKNNSKKLTPRCCFCGLFRRIAIMRCNKVLVNPFLQNSLRNPQKIRWCAATNLPLRVQTCACPLGRRLSHLLESLTSCPQPYPHPDARHPAQSSEPPHRCSVSTATV